MSTHDIPQDANWVKPPVVEDDPVLEDDQPDQVVEGIGDEYPGSDDEVPPVIGGLHP